MENGGIPATPVLAVIGTVLASLMAAGLAEIIHQSSVLGQIGTDRAMFDERMASLQTQIDRRLNEERKLDDQIAAHLDEDRKELAADMASLAELKARIDLGRSERVESDAQITARLNALAARFEDISSRVMQVENGRTK